MEVRKGYKQTAVGVIPEGWSVQKLRSLVHQHNAGIYKKKELYGNGYNIVGVSDLYDIHHVGGQEFRRVPLSEQERKQYTLRSNDLLYGESSLVREGIARTVYVTEGGAGTAFAWHTRRYCVNQEDLLSNYLYYYLQTCPARKHMMEKCIQTAITGINTADYFACPIPLPPHPEQRAIATALSDADTLISSLEKLIAKKQNIKQAAMQGLLTGKKRLPGFSGVWEVKKLGEIGDFKNGKAHESFISDSGRYIVVNSKFISSEGEVIKYSDSCLCPVSKGEILMVMSDVPNGKAIAKCFLVKSNDKYTVNQRICSLKAKEVDSKFLFYKLNRNPYYLTFDDGVKQTNLRKEDILNCELLIPKYLEEQTAIAQVLSDIDAEIEQLEQKLSKYRLLKQGMMQELLTGKTRLV